MSEERVTKCGISLDRLIGGNICAVCGGNSSRAMSCTVRPQDIIPKRLYDFARNHSCVRQIYAGIYAYDENLFLEYISKHPSEIRKRKWLQEIAKQHNIEF